MKIAAPAGCARLSVLRDFVASARRSIGFVLIVTLSVFTGQRLNAIQLLPGVSGYGLDRTDNPAGYGPSAQVIEVTDLGDSGPGTLREAVETDLGTVRRIVVFKKSGVITLNTQLWVKYNNTTIAGQTAPYPGIALHGAPLLVVANEVLVQHLRVRPGDRWYNGDITKNLTMIRDAAQVTSGIVSVKNVVFDHCTFAWSLDECVSAYNGFNNLTFNKCLFAEPLYLSIHMDENIFNPNQPQQAQALSQTFGSASGTTASSGLAMSGTYHLVNADAAGDWVEYTLNIKPSTAHTGCYIGLTGITGTDRGQFKITVYEGTTVLQTSTVFDMYAGSGTESQKDFIARSATPFNIPNTTTGTPKTYRVRVQTTGPGAGGGFKLGIDQLYIAQNHAMGPYFTDGYTNAPSDHQLNHPELTSGKLTMIGNAFAHLQARGPWVGAQDFYFANNVLYNRREWMLQLGVDVDYRAMRAAVIANTFIEGPSWNGPNSDNSNTPIRRNTNHLAGMNLYVDVVATSSRRNEYKHGLSGTPPVYNSTSAASDPTARGDGLPAGFTAQTTTASYADVILTAGARPLERDSMELRIFDEIDDAYLITSPYTSRPGSLKNTVAEAGGWPNYGVNNSTWSTVPSNTDTDGDGYTNIEEWLEGLSQTLITGTYQGENATYSGGALTAADVTGYHATGFVNFAVGSVATPSVATYTNVPGKTGGSRTLRIRYSNGSASARTGQLVVNGGTPVAITFPTTGSFSTWMTLDVPVTVNAGHNNTIAFRATGNDLGNIDEFTIL